MQGPVRRVRRASGARRSCLDPETFPNRSLGGRHHTGSLKPPAPDTTADRNPMTSETNNTGTSPGLGERVARGVPGAVGLLLRRRTAVKFLLHLVLFASAYLASFLVRFDLEIPPRYQEAIGATILLMLAAKAAGFAA